MLRIQGNTGINWDFFGKIAMHSMGFVVTVFLALLFEPSDFAIILTIGIFTVFKDVVLGDALIRRKYFCKRILS